MNDVIFNEKDICVINADMLNQLKHTALKSPNHQARICLHKNTDEHVQQMIIAQTKDIYVRPHKHVEKTESFHVIDGKACVIIFDDNGAVTESIILDSSSKTAALCRIEKNYWHTLVPLSDFIVFHEITGGPFNKEHHSIFAPWSCEKQDIKAIQDFKKKIMGIIA